MPVRQALQSAFPVECRALAKLRQANPAFTVTYHNPLPDNSIDTLRIIFWSCTMVVLVGKWVTCLQKGLVEKLKIATFRCFFGVLNLAHTQTRQFLRPAPSGAVRSSKVAGLGRTHNNPHLLH